MQRSKRILYIGTYERDYPRNVTVIAAMRRAGYDVREIHRSVWAAAGDKSAMISSPARLANLGLRLIVAYVSLIRDLIRARNDADLIAFGYIGQLDVLVLGPVARLMGKPILFNPLVTLTDTLVEDRQTVAPNGPPARIIRLIDRLSLGLSTSVLADTVENQQFVTTMFKLPRSKVRVIPVGADDEVFHPPLTPTEINRNGSPLRVLFYGNMIPLQGVETIVRAANLLRDEPDVTFDIVGTGQVFESIRSQARNLHVDNITFIPRWPYEQLPLQISRSDIILGIFGDSPKAARVVPNKVYQAMAMGASIVTRDSPASREMLHDGESALLISPADSESLAAAIRQLRDPALRQRLGLSARDRYVKAASLEVQTVRVDQVITQLLGERATVHGEVMA
ncbi:MAG: glycosyltransferase [Nitrolancea sp.]